MMYEMWVSMQVVGYMNEAERSREWFNELPRHDGIYRTIEELTRGERLHARIKAAVVLGESGDPRAVGPLIECCRDQNAEMRRYATEALLKLGSGRAVSALITRLKDPEEEWITRTRAAEALASISTNQAIEALIERLKDTVESPAVRMYIAEVLKQVKNPRVTQALEECLKDESMGMRRVSREVLEKRKEKDVPSEGGVVLRMTQHYRGYESISFQGKERDSGPQVFRG